MMPAAAASKSRQDTQGLFSNRATNMQLQENRRVQGKTG